MTVDELKEALTKEKLACYDYLRSMSRITREDLDNAGYKGLSKAETIKMILDAHVAKIELMVRKWEKENPDG